MVDIVSTTTSPTSIKKDRKGQPTRAKYQIVVLGNLDPNNWSKQDCFAPVLSQLELRLLISIAVKKKCIPKSGDITQTFCQNYLPDGEHYICILPPGCFLTPPNTFWKLKKSLYGLKRSPCHWPHFQTPSAAGLKTTPFVTMSLHRDNFDIFLKSKICKIWNLKLKKSTKDHDGSSNNDNFRHQKKEVREEQQ